MAGDLVRAVGALVSLVALGLTFGFSPPLYGVTLHLLARNPNPHRAIVYLTTGMGLAATMLLLAFRTFDPKTLAAELSGQIAHFLVQTLVDLIVGGVLVIVGFVMLRLAQRPRPVPASAPLHERARESHPQAMIGVGFANTAIGVAPPVTMYVTGRVIAGATSHLTLQLGAYGVFLAAVIAPYFAAGYLWRRFPALSNRITRAWARLMKLDLRPLVGWGLVIAGLVFLLLGASTAVRGS